nr:cache domain-containing protein [Campylobacter hepaticus]
MLKQSSDLGNAKDSNGIFYVQELYKKALNKGGFVSYKFTKPQNDGSTVIADKTSYSYLIPYNLILIKI